jgi:hypothetical protein
MHANLYIVGQLIHVNETYLKSVFIFAAVYHDLFRLFCSFIPDSFVDHGATNRLGLA